MSAVVKVLAQVHVTVVVPHTVKVDIDDFEQWRAARGHDGPPWTTDLTDNHDEVIEYLKADDDGDGEVFRNLPEVNVREHGIWNIEINELEVIAA